MAELTPSTMDVLFRPNDGLRKLADQVARNVTTWYRDLWWRTSSTVAVDFFHSTDIVDVAIESSLKRVRCANPAATPDYYTTSTVATTSLTTLLQPFADERSDRRRFYQGPRSLDSVESTTESIESLTTTSKLPRLTVRRRRPKNTTTTVAPTNLQVTSLV